MRDVVVGGSGRLQIALGKNLPRLADKYMERSLFEQQKTYDRDHVDEGSLERPQADGRAWGLHKGHVMRSSAYTTTTLSPMLKTMAFASVGLTLAAGVKRWRTAA